MLMPRSLQQRIEAHFSYWRPVLGLEGWSIKLRYDEKKLKGYCITSPKYLEATLGFNPKKIRAFLRAEKNQKHWYDPLEELVLHEMVHILNPRSSETAVSQTTYALLRAREL